MASVGGTDATAGELFVGAHELAERSVVVAKTLMHIPAAQECLELVVKVERVVRDLHIRNSMPPTTFDSGVLHVIEWFTRQFQRSLRPGTYESKVNYGCDA